jgi:hypothetical protein
VWEEISRDDKDMAALGVVPELMAGSPGAQQQPAEE